MPAWLAFALVLGLLSLRMYVPREWGDGGYFVGAAERILAGEVLYRDFQHNYPPGRMFALAGLMALFGKHWVVVRIFWVACHAAAAAVALRVGQRLMPLPLAGLLSLAVAFNSAQLNKTVELLLAACVLLVLFRVAEGRTRAWAAGVQLALVAQFRHDVAFMGSLLFVGLLVLEAWDRRGEGTLASALRARRSALGGYALGFGLTLVPLLAYLVVQGALGDALRELLFSGVQANAVLARAYPPFVEDWTWSGVASWGLSRSASFYLVPALYLLAVLLGMRDLRQPARRAEGVYLLLVAGLGALLFAQVAVRTDLGHLNKAFVPAHVLQFWLVGRAGRMLARAWRARRGPAVAVGALAVLGAATLPYLQFRVHGEPPDSLTRVLLSRLTGAGPYYERVSLPRGPLVLRQKDAMRMRQVVLELEKYADRRGEETLVAYPSGASFNFLWGYASPVPFDVLRPGELGDRSDEVLARIQEARPRVLIRNDEGTNDAFCDALSAWARDQGYKRMRAAALTFWIRQDD